MASHDIRQGALAWHALVVMLSVVAVFAETGRADRKARREEASGKK
jgi:hypothetical protein